LFGAVDLLAFYRHCKGSPVEKIKARAVASNAKPPLLFYTKRAVFQGTRRRFRKNRSFRAKNDGKTPTRRLSPPSDEAEN